MAAVLDQKQDPAAKFDTQVDEHIAEATSRIRFHDLTFGGLIVAALVLAYVAAIVVLDKYLVLPEWVRQVSLAAFVAGLGTVAWLTLVRPFRRQINPLYAAVQVERTIEDAKNSVAGYVDAKQNEKVHPTVRAAMGARAAKAAAQADLNEAVDHRSLVWVGGVVVALLLVLVVLFFVFRPSQFKSLAGRALLPFSSDSIATRTQLTLQKPDPADLTITTGQSVTVAVYVAGKVPAESSPERVRLLVRHNPADPNYEVVPMEKGESSRDWQVRVPDYLVQNGFWYKVAAGDTETNEHKVTVRTLPLFTDFDVTYEFPEYLRMKPATAKEHRLVAFRGTKVTLIGKTNREVKDGRMDVDPTGEKVAGKPAPQRPDSLRFEYKLVETGSYRLHLVATNGERNIDPPPFAIQVLSDQAPTIAITKPEEDEIPLPANGQLAVDAAVNDDFGVDAVVLRMKLVGEKETQLADKKYQDGKSFLRETDKTWPTSVEYKDSVDLAKVKDTAGLPFDLKEGMVIEYWLEAADNCTEPKPNVGKSKPKRVRLTAPKTQEMEQTQQREQKTQRNTEEQKHNQAQNEKHANEHRPPPQNPNQPQEQPKGEKSETPKGGDKTEQPKTGGAGDMNPPKKDDTNPPKSGTNDTPMPKGMEPMGKPPEGMGTEPKTDTPMKGGEGQPPKNENTQGGMGQQGGMPNEAPPPSDKGNKDLEKQADEVQQQIDKQNKQEGTGKGNPSANENERTEPSQPKPQPMGANKPEDGKTKPEPQPNPMGGGGGESKGEGNLQQPPDPSAPKPPPQQNPMGGNKGGEPAQTKREPLGGSAGDDKPEPKEPPKGMNDPANPPKKNEDPKSGSTGKPQSGGEPQGGEQPRPQNPENGAGAPKPMNQPNRGTDKDPQATPQTGGTPPQEKPEGGDGKPQQTPQPAAGKPGPKDENANKTDKTQPKPAPQPGMNDPMMPNPGSAAESKADGSQQPMAGGMPPPKGVEKAEEKPPAGSNAQANPPEPKNGAGGKKPDEKAVKDAFEKMSSDDPKEQKAGRDAMDKQVGPEARKQAEKMIADAKAKSKQEADQLRKDLNSDDPKTRAAAQQKLNDMMKQADEMAKKEAEKKGGGAGEKMDPKDIEKAVNDLNSPDQKMRDAAKEKLEKQFGDKGREQAEQIAKDMQSGDKGKQADAQQKLDDLKKQAGEQANKGEGPKQPGDKKLTKEEAEALAKQAADLASPDDAKRQAAEKEFDDKIGKENRAKLQEAMKDAQSPDPQKREEAKKKLEAMVRDMNPTGNKMPDRTASSPQDDKRTILEDKRKRLESAQLQLEQFEKNRHNKDLHDKLGWNQGDFDRFMADMKRLKEQLEKEVAVAEAMPETTAPLPGTPGTNVGGGNKVVGREATGSANVGGVGVAPPGYSKAAREFQEALQKLNNQKK